jgi:hypothetical protein
MSQWVNEIHADPYRAQGLSFAMDVSMDNQRSDCHRQSSAGHHPSSPAVPQFSGKEAQVAGSLPVDLLQ